MATKPPHRHQSVSHPLPMSRHSYKLIYPSKLGRAEPIRLLFHYLNTPFEDLIPTTEEWNELKPNSPTGQVPYIEVDGGKFRLGQSVTICRYLAKAIDPEACHTKPEAALCDMHADMFADLFNAAAYVKYMPEETKESMKEMFTKTCKNVLSCVEKRLAQTGKFLAGSKILWCDVYATAVMMLVETFVGELFVGIMQENKQVVDFYYKMRSSNKLKDYIEENWPNTAVKFE